MVKYIGTQNRVYTYPWHSWIARQTPQHCTLGDDGFLPYNNRAEMYAMTPAANSEGFTFREFTILISHTIYLPVAQPDQASAP